MAQSPDELDEKTASGVKTIVFSSLFLLVVGGCSAMGAQAAIAAPTGAEVTPAALEDLSQEQLEAHQDLMHLVQDDPRRDPIGYSSLVVAFLALAASFGLSTRRAFGLWLSKQALVALMLAALASMASLVAHFFEVRPELERLFAAAQAAEVPELPETVDDFYTRLVAATVPQTLLWVTMVFYVFVQLRRPHVRAAWEYMLSLREQS